jgi:outer membrane protein TolC
MTRTRSPALPSGLAAGLLAGLLSTVLATAAIPALARCVDEDSPDPIAAPDGAAENATASDADPRGQLAELVREVQSRSHAMGAAKLMAEAALSDVEEARAGKQIQASAQVGLGPAATQTAGVADSSMAQSRVSVNVSQLLYDGGRVDAMTDWRQQLAESARLGQMTLQEQLALTTVSLALERNRFRLQVQVYQQYARKMSCLVEALETIVRSDRGRASELVQAKKSQAQALLSQTQAQSQVRQVEVRLRRLVGDGLPPVQGLSTVLLKVPDLDALQADAEQSAEIAQLGTQASAASRFADAVQAGGKPQLSWNFGGSKAQGVGGTLGTANSRTSSFSLGLTLNVPLMNPGIVASSDAARKRAQAAVLQRAEALQSRVFRLAEIYEQAGSTFDRARRTANVLRDSDQVRNFTLQQWQQLGKRSLFDVMGAEGEHYNLRVAYINAVHDGQQLNAILLSLGRGVGEWLR